MKKRLLAIIITLCMLGTQLSAVGFADEVTETTEAGPITVMVEATEQSPQEIPCTCETLCSENEINTDCAVCSAKGANLQEVCAGDEAMAFVPGLTSLSSSSVNDDALSFNPSYLNDLEMGIYSVLAAKIESVAVTGGRMVFTLRLNGISFDNGGETDNDKLLNLAFDYFFEEVNNANVFSCLLSEYPYEMFWFDKMDSSLGSMGINISNSGNTTYIDSITYYMPVYDTYQDKSVSQPEYTLSADAASKAAQAAAYAKEIVDANAGKSDMEKLEAYKDAICDLTSYDLEAVEIVGDPEHPLFDTFYGDPFQITSVFDRDPDTKTIGEGYAKAFQYLCDLSDFDSTQCYYVAGEMSGTGTSEFIPGGEQHWLNFSWNIVKIEGKSYLVDLLNCDEGTFGEPDYVFMKEPIRGNVNDGYWFSGANGSEVHYIYGDQFVSRGLLDTTILDLNGRYMTGSITLSGTAKIGETLTAEIKGVPTNSTIQWYRDDTPVPGANGNTYTISSGEDVGKTIKVVVSASGCEGTLTAQTSEKVVKASPEPVNDINILSITDTSITIETHPGEVYACVDESTGDIVLPSEDQWGTSGEFTGLSAGKVYAIFARRNETDTHYGTSTNGYKYELVTTSNRIIMRVEVTVDAPVKYQDLPTTATVNTANMTATLEWYEGTDTSGQPVTGKAKPNQYYVAKVTLTADEGYEFGKGCFVKVNSTTAEFPYEGMSVMGINVGFVEPTAPVELTNIEITKQPDKTDYIAGENFDPTGMAVTAYYDDGSNKAVDLSECTFSPETLTGGVESVTVSYGGKSASVPVTVTVPVELTGIEISKQPNKTEYKENESFDPTGMEITAKYSDGSTESVSVADCTFSPEIITQGVTSVTVSYKGKTASVPVTVLEAELTGIEVTKKPDKTEYFDGESFDPTGMEITASYENGSKKIISTENCTFSPETLTTGVTSVTVSYNGKTASVPVTVKAVELTGIEITKQPDKTEYFDGESFDPAGIEVMAVYNNGSKEPVSVENCTFSPEKLTTGVTSVTVSYNGKTAAVSVTVKAIELTAIEIIKQPDKTVYDIGDKFDPTGMEVTAIYNNGSKELVSIDECTFSPETLTEGLTSVTVSYGGKTASVAVTVKIPELTGIKITKQPDKIAYYPGESFDPTGMEIEARYENGSKESVQLNECSFTPDVLSDGDTEVTVNYGGKTAIVYVAVYTKNNNPNWLYVGDTSLPLYPDNPYFTSNDGGKTWKEYKNGIPEDNYIRYEGGVLTLHNATIVQDDFLSDSNGAGIYAAPGSNKSLALTIILEGENTISGSSYGIFVTGGRGYDSAGQDTSLTIQGPGSLNVKGSNGNGEGILIISGNGNPTLTLNNASVVAGVDEGGSYGTGIGIQSGVDSNNPEITVNVNGGSLTAGGSNCNDGIFYYFGSHNAVGSAKLNVSGDAVVNAVNGIKASRISEPHDVIISNSADIGGIIFDGKDGTVYGDVELQEDIIIEDGKSLTIPEDSNLNTGSHIVTVKSDGSLNGTVGGTVKIAPTITTESLIGGYVGTYYEQQLKATGDPTITWSITEGALPEGLTIDKDTGKIFGTPAAKGTYSFTVAATNSVDTHCKEFSIEIKEYEKGDVNMDGTVNIPDATAIQYHISSLPIEGTFNESLADVNNDGIISIVDVTLIQLNLANKTQ